MALLFLDLDKFKQVNDSFGHAAGDQVLHQVAGRLQRCLREADTVARMAGDEFVILLENLGEASNLAKIVGAVGEAISQPMDIAGHVLSIKSSIGLALFPRDGGTAHQLLSHADAAMYAAKKTSAHRLFVSQTSGVAAGPGKTKQRG